VNKAVDSSDVRYAVIAGLRTETGPERLVIAYPNEESLRDLIAAPSIIALGFSTREEAIAGTRAAVPAGATYPRMPEAIAGRAITLRRLARFLVTSYSEIAATAIVILSSTNAVSAAIRMALGSSV